MIATFINVAAIIAGGLLGSLFGNRLGEKYSKGLMTVIGLICLMIGVQDLTGAQSTLVVVVSMVLGTVLGMALKLDERISGCGDWLMKRLKNTSFGQGSFAEAFVTCSVLFSVGSMTILGSIQAGLYKDYTVLFTKSIMDFVSCLAFSAALGPGAVLACVPVLLVQGTLTLLASFAAPLLSSAAVAEMSAVGGVIFLGLGIELLGLRQEKIKVGDMLPAIFLPLLYHSIKPLLGI